MNNPVFNEAAKRAIFGGFITAMTTFFPLLTQTTDWRMLVSAVGGAFFGYIAIRGATEGWIDSNRAADGRAIAGDVPVASKKLDVTKV
jgi:hypothetical protein